MSASGKLIVEHTFAPPRAKVFEAWSHTEVLRRWWACLANLVTRVFPEVSR